MRKIKLLSVLTLFTFTLSARGQIKNDHIMLGRHLAEKELKAALTRKESFNVVNNKAPIIKDSLTAIKIAEPILFNIYGKKDIMKERPYEVYLVKNFWVISGTLPKGYLGGTFLIIIDSRNCKVIEITHGK